jgi:hypothetical protein
LIFVNVHLDKRKLDCQASLILQAFSQDRQTEVKITLFGLAGEEQ